MAASGGSWKSGKFNPAGKDASEDNRSRVEGTVHLQNVGSHSAIRIGNLRPGDTIVYNYGYTAIVKSVSPNTKRTSVTYTTVENGKEYTRTRRAGTLVGFKVR